MYGAAASYKLNFKSRAEIPKVRVSLTRAQCLKSGSKTLSESKFGGDWVRKRPIIKRKVLRPRRHTLSNEQALDVTRALDVYWVAEWLCFTLLKIKVKTQIQINKHTNTNKQIHKYTNTQIHKCDEGAMFIEWQSGWPTQLYDLCYSYLDFCVDHLYFPFQIQRNIA